MTLCLNDCFNKYCTSNENGKCQMILQGLITTWKWVDTSDIRRLKLSYAYFRTNSLLFVTQIRERQINPSLEMLCCDPSQLRETAAVYEIFWINKLHWAVFQWTNLLWALNLITGNVCIRNLSFACSPAQCYTYTVTKKKKILVKDSCYFSVEQRVSSIQGTSLLYHWLDYFNYD